MRSRMRRARTAKPAMSSGRIASGFEEVAAEFEANLVARGDKGAAFAASVDGELVVNIWGGTRDENAAKPWTEDTTAAIYSGSKGMVAACLAMLLARGVLDLEAPVCRYWPEFAAAGKRGLLVRHVVSHQGQLPGLKVPVTAREATEPLRMASMLAAQKPEGLPGRFQYHALTFGWLCGRLIQLIDGRSVGRMFDEEFARPLGLRAWIGLPANQAHTVAWSEEIPPIDAPNPSTAVSGAAFNPTRPQGRHEWSVWANPPRVGVDPLPANQPYWRAAEVPASNGVASARSMAELYASLIGHGARRPPERRWSQALELATARLTDAMEPTLRKRMAFGVGFQLQTPHGPFGPVGVAFGHEGTGGSVHGAWPERAVSFSYVTRSLVITGPDKRACSLLRALADAT